MSKTLIAFFSHDGEAYANGRIIPLEIGNTRLAADYVKELSGADIFRIEPEIPYPFKYTETVDIAKKEQNTDARPAYTGKVKNMDDYACIILCYPNWWGTLPQIVMSFLEDFSFSGKTIMPLCTNEGSGMGRSASDITKLCSGAIIGKGLPIRGSKVKKSKPEIERWLTENNIIEEETVK